MDSLAGQTVSLLADRTIKVVHFIIVNTPAVTVGCLAVKTVGCLAFCCCQASLQILLEIFVIQ
jgi:hypothetical protein